MNKLITIISCALAAVPFVYMFNNNVFLCVCIGVGVALLLLIGFKIESLLRTKGNKIVNTIIYYLSSNDENYNILDKHVTYTYYGNDEYECIKKYEIYPQKHNVDSMNDKYAWSAPSQGVILQPTQSGHEINNQWQQDMWSCFTIYFNETCTKHRAYKAGVEIKKLIDKQKLAVPYLSATIDKKTRSLTLVAKIPRALRPKNGQLKVFSPKSITDEVYSYDVEYDDGVGGFKQTVDYPRKGWKYVISWETEIAP